MYQLWYCNEIIGLNIEIKENYPYLCNVPLSSSSFFQHVSHFTLGMHAWAFRGFRSHWQDMPFGNMALVFLEMELEWRTWLGGIGPSLNLAHWIPSQFSRSSHLALQSLQLRVPKCPQVLCWCAVELLSGSVHELHSHWTFGPWSNLIYNIYICMCIYWSFDSFLHLF